MTDADRRTVDILLVEDSPSDAELARKALARGRMPSVVHHVHDGIEALQFLLHEEPYTDAPRPDLILLDLNMPRMDGRKTLQRIKEDDELAGIPVVVLTTSAEQADVLAVYGSRANAYIVKPIDLKAFFQVVADIDHFWFSVVTLPPKESA